MSQQPADGSLRLVLDTNIVFSALIADGYTRELLLSETFSFYVPEFFYEELMAHRDEVREKTGLPSAEFQTLIDLLFEDIIVVPREDFDHQLAIARTHIEETDPDDAPFIALALHLEADIWTDDSDFQHQDAVDIWQTHQLIDLFEG